MGMNIIGVLFKAPIENEEEFIESLFSRTITESTKATWEDGQGGLPRGEYVLVYQKNGATNIYFENTPNFSKPPFYKLLDENQGVVFACGETAMTFVFEFYENGTVQEDSYVFEAELIQEGKNRLNLTEEDDVIHDGLFVLQDEYMGGTHADDLITIYMLSGSNVPERSTKNDRHIEAYYENLFRFAYFGLSKKEQELKNNEVFKNLPELIIEKCASKHNVLYDFHSTTDNLKTKYRSTRSEELESQYSLLWESRNQAIDEKTILDGSEIIKLDILHKELQRRNTDPERLDHVIDEYYRLILKNTTAAGKTLEHTKEVQRVSDLLPVECQRLLEEGKPIHKFHSKIDDWEANLPELDLREYETLDIKFLSRLEKGEITSTHEFILGLLLEERISKIKKSNRRGDYYIFLTLLCIALILYFILKQVL